MNNIKLALLLFVFILCTSLVEAQNIGAWSVLEYDSIAPTSVVTKGTRLTYSKKYNSFYRWDVLCSCWKRFAGPGIIDTSYSLSFSSPNLSLLGSGSSTSLSNLYSMGWGLLKSAETLRVDSSKVASRYYVSTSPTTIAANYIATSNGTNLVARNLFDNNTYAGVISRPWKFGEWTTAGRPTGVIGYHGFNNTLGYQEFYDGSTWFPTGFWAKSGNNLSYTAGKVGIGMAPTATLDIKEAAQATSMVDIHNPSELPYSMRVFNDIYSSTNPLFGYFAYNSGKFAMGNLQAADYELFTNGYLNPSLTILGSNGAIKIGGNTGSAGNTYLFKNGNIGLGTASPSYTLDIAWTDAARFFGGTTAQRPTRTARLIRYNSDSLGFEIANSTTWLKLLNRTDIVLQNSRSGNNVSIRNPGGTATTFSVSDPDTLSISGSTLSVSGGNSVTIPWLKTELEAGRSVHIKAASGDTLSIKNAQIQMKGSTGKTAFLLSPSAATFEVRPDNYIDFRDTSSTMEIYEAISGGLAVPGSGQGLRRVIYHPKLGSVARPGDAFRNLYQLRVDTTISGIATLRIFNGVFFQNNSTKTVMYYGAIGGGTEASHQFRSYGTSGTTAGSKAMAVIDRDDAEVFSIKNSGSFWAGSDSSFSYSRVDNTLKLKGYGLQAKEAADLSKTFGNIEALATDGTVLDYLITRDTTANDVDFTVTSTLLSSCQELVITAQLLGKGSDLTITLPTPSATYKGNKVGIFVVDVALQKIVISGSMYYTTDPALVTPTVQSSLNTETFYKSRNGAYYDFVCARNVDGNYYWKLKQ